MLHFTSVDPANCHNYLVCSNMDCQYVCNSIFLCFFNERFKNGVKQDHNQQGNCQIVQAHALHLDENCLVSSRFKHLVMLVAAKEKTYIYTYIIIIWMKVQTYKLWKYVCPTFYFQFANTLNLSLYSLLLQPCGINQRL